ncbi:glyoxalase [Agromyces badenianii]|uniref:Glyoxalase n=1 Tax=Agromyces badenianii TaxID=2080742 RepID=A0A2S0WUP8_9MICO|nr:glyoxalase [Agromyces badenianii]AWB95018.1 glyoxalase [Agromyces badenianii]PWC03094.1 glyoxalase [Agromyces badenianii]
MFEKLMAMAVLPATDLARARAYWHDVLGHTPVHSDEAGDVFDFGGAGVLIYQTKYAGTAKNTALTLITDNLERDMTALRTNGVTFHDYDMPGLKTVDGVADLGSERGAWFSDSEGNIIAISQPSPEMMEQAISARAAAASG